MSMNSSLDTRLFQGLITCLNKRVFHNEQQFTNDFIFDQIYSSIDVDRAEADVEINSFDQVRQGYNPYSFNNSNAK